MFENSMLSKPGNVFLKLVSLERLINLFKTTFNNTINIKKAYIVFPAYNEKVLNDTEAYKLDAEDVQYLYTKYSNKYREELEDKLKQLDNG